MLSPGFHRLVQLRIILCLVVEWIEPNGWIGPDPVLYWNFDTPERMSLMEGTEESNFPPLVSGKVILQNCKIYLTKLTF